MLNKRNTKNMLMGSNGHNIYPEKIENKLSSMALVNECIVMQRGDKLIGLVHPDYDEARSLNLSDSDIENVMEENRKQLNEELPAYCRLSAITIHEEEFAKTPKRSIKRFLYTK